MRASMIPVMNLKTNLKRLLLEHNLSASRLSKITGIAPATLSAWQSGGIPKDLRKVKKLADHFHLTIDQLCFGNGRNEFKESPLHTYAEEINAGYFEVVLRRKR